MTEEDSYRTADFLIGVIVGLVAEADGFLFYATMSHDSNLGGAANDNDWRPIRDGA